MSLPSEVCNQKLGICDTLHTPQKYRGHGQNQQSYPSTLPPPMCERLTSMDAPGPRLRGDMLTRTPFKHSSVTKPPPTATPPEE